MIRKLASIAVLAEVGPSGTTDSTTIALYSMISVIVVALITVGGQIVVTRLSRRNAATPNPRPGNTNQRKVSKEHEAWERWLLLNGYDPRKIETGYEPLEEVRRASN